MALRSYSVEGDGRLIGRSAELGFAEACLRQTPPRAVVLSGYPGIGKTRVAREIAERWPERGDPTWVIASANARAIPGGAILRLVAHKAAEQAAGSTAEGALVMAALEQVRRRAGVVIVDDIHLLDDVSVLFAQHLVLDATVPTVMTMRGGEVVAPGLVALWESGLAEQLELLPLNEEETAALASANLRGQLDEQTRSALFTASRGNPLLLLELMRDAIESGALKQHRSGWSWNGAVGGHRLRDAIERRLGVLDAPRRRVVAALAVGEPLGLSLLRNVSPNADIEAAQRAGFVRVSLDGQRTEARLGHPLIGEVLVKQLSQSELDEVRRGVADAITTFGARRAGDLLIVAKLRLDARDPSDPPRLKRAASVALELRDGNLAVQFASAALRAQPGDATARLLLAEAYLFCERYHEAASELLRLASAEVPDGDLARVAQGLQHAYRLLGQPENVEPTLVAIRGRMRDAVWQGVVDCLAAQQYMFEGRSRAGLTRGESILLEHDDPRVHLRLVPIVGVGRILSGKTQSGLDFVAQMLPIALQLHRELPLAPDWVINAQGIGLMLAGRLDDAMAFVDLIRAMTSRGGHPHAGPMLDVFEGRIELLRGDAGRALELLDSACAVLGPDHFSGLSKWTYSLRAEATALTGATEEARLLRRQAETLRSTMELYEGDARRARAWVAALAGEVHTAIADLDEVAALQELEGQHSLEVVTLHHAVRVGAGSTIRARLARAAQRADTLFAAVYRRHVDALERRDGTELEAVAEGFMELGLRLEAAEVYAAAAQAHERAALRRRASAAFRQSEEIFSTTGAVRTPLLRTEMVRAELTEREREVVDLAAQGLSNREIAERLFVSVRTVEGHLYRACTKLGVADRRQLAAVLGQR